MARNPNLSTPVAVVRTALGLTAEEFAKLVGCGKSTINHIENLDRPLKGDLADAIHFTTGIPRDWLDRPLRSLSVDEVRGWLARGARPGSTYKPRDLHEHRTSGGPVFFGSATFPKHDVVPRIAAVFYSLGLTNLNPHLALLAVRRALSDVISRFSLAPEAVARLEREIGAFYFPSTDDLKAEIVAERGSPGHQALAKHYAETQDLLGAAERTAGLDGFKRARKKMVAEALDVTTRKRRRPKR